jgi:hypothetical protein
MMWSRIKIHPNALPRRETTMTQAEQHDATQVPTETTSIAGPIRAYKAFDQNMQCRGFQFEVGKTYEHDGPVKACESGFHACENPLDVWSYYPLDSRYAAVEMGGDFSRHDDDSKISAARITISAEITLPQIIRDGVAYLMGLCKDAFALKPGGDASGYGSQLAASGHGSQLAASGYDSQLAASGHGSQLAASGHGSQLAASGENCVCVAASLGSTARAGAGGAIALTYHDGERYRIAVAYVGEGGIEPNVNYRVTDAGEFVEAQG